MSCEVAIPLKINTLSFKINIKFSNEEILIYIKEIGFESLPDVIKMIVNLCVVQVQN